MSTQSERSQAESSVPRDGPGGGASAAEITRRSKSNLAFALACLPRQKRADMRVFYAFCRVVDDIADDETLAPETRRAGLERWRRGLREGFAGGDRLEGEVESLIERHDLSREHFLEIIAGVEMDLDRVRFETFEELRSYCYRVACVVGLVSADLFGAQHTGTREYAVALGYALQITNIIRDVGHDWRTEGRIYLPREDLAAFDYGEAELAREVRDERFLGLMRREAGRAHRYYEEAAALLPAEDRRVMVAAEIMRAIYSRLLDKMEKDGFRVYQKKYRLHRIRMLGTFARVYGACLFGRA